MQFTSNNIAELWNSNYRNLYIYELTKTNKVIKFKVTDLVEFDTCVIMKIENNDIKHRLMFNQSSSTKKRIGDSIFFTDFNLIKSKFNAKEGLEELKEDIKNHEEALTASKDHLLSKKKTLERLEKGMNDENLKSLEEEDKVDKEIATSYLTNTIFLNVSKYGTDISFTFLVDRIWAHSTTDIPKENFIKDCEKKTNEELSEMLNAKIKNTLK